MRRKPCCVLTSAAVVRGLRAVVFVDRIVLRTQTLPKRCTHTPQSSEQEKSETKIAACMSTHAQRSAEPMGALQAADA